MATLDKADYTLHLPPEGVRAELDQDEEWCWVETGGVRRRIRFHDYAAIYSIPGLYERLFAGRLECRSPTIVCDLLGEQLRVHDVRPSRLTALDFGAGNGMVGEQLDDLAIGEIVGVDLLAEARDAAERDRPGLYCAYYALDLAELSPDDERTLMDHDFDVMTCVAALGFGDIPPRAFAEALHLVGSPGWIAFNLRDRFLDDPNPSGFGALIARMLDEGIIVELARKRYVHRRSVDDEPLDYFAFVCEKRADVPLEWTPEAEER